VNVGGRLRQVGVLTAAAQVAVDELFGTGPNGESGVLKQSYDRRRRSTACGPV
jgi:threonine aldolase